MQTRNRGALFGAFVASVVLIAAAGLAEARPGNGGGGNRGGGNRGGGGAVRQQRQAPQRQQVQRSPQRQTVQRQPQKRYNVERPARQQPRVQRQSNNTSPSKYGYVKRNPWPKTRPVNQTVRNSQRQPNRNPNRMNPVVRNPNRGNPAVRNPNRNPRNPGRNPRVVRNPRVNRNPRVVSGRRPWHNGGWNRPHWRQSHWGRNYRYNHVMVERRRHHFFGGFYRIGAPVFVYRDCYNPGFFWWLGTLSLAERDLWYYHHWHELDPNRIAQLEAEDVNLRARIAALEAQNYGQINPNYCPTGIDPDLQYNDDYLKADQ